MRKRVREDINRQSISLRGITAFVVISIAIPAPSLAQDQSDIVRRLERQMQQIDASYRLVIPSDQPISERLVLDFGGATRFGLYGIDDENSSTHFLRQTDTTFYLRAEFGKPLLAHGHEIDGRPP